MTEENTLDQEPEIPTYTVPIKGKDYKLLITLGFWKKCGFKRDEAEVIQDDPKVYSLALKLALFYGNKKDMGWNNQKDMEAIIDDDSIDDLEVDYAQDLSMAMIHYLPPKLRMTILNKMKNMDKQVEESIDDAMNNALDHSNSDDDSKKK